MPRLRIVLFAFVAVTCAAVVLPTVAWAQAPAAPRTQRPAALLRGPFGPIVQQVQRAQLTPDQRRQMLGIFKAHESELRALADKTRAARQRWQQSGQVSIGERRDLLAQRATIMKQVRTEVFALLTPEQQKRLLARRPALRR